MHLSKDSFGCSYRELLQNHIQPESCPDVRQSLRYTGTAVALRMTELSYALRFFQLNLPEDKGILNLSERWKTEPSPADTDFFMHTSAKKTFLGI